MFLTTRRPNLYPMGTGLDRLVDEFFENSFKEVGVNKYPATDIYTEDGVTHIEVAVTGFSEDDIEVSLDNGILSIKGSKETEEQKDERKYHSRNIAKRSFIRQFNIADNVEDISANIKDGILHLELIQKEKEETKRLIKIGPWWSNINN